ncbi:MAG: hypothetical protein KatS3mg121_1409 [Gammaproteobacteria bacterium]|nr:MAG: hypothetical protein KatS3mg121_1409 [Gammaproteobacteria bacterium]
MARRVLVMHRGRIVEAGEVARVFTAPEADYTRRLIEAIPSRSKPYPSRADGRALLEVEDLRVDYDTAAGAFERRRRFTAVDGVSLRIEGGEVLGLVGESGSGKSTLARAVMRLLRPEAGRIRLAGNDITTLGERALRPLRRRWQMVFQDPYASLNPRLSVAEALCEPLRVHGLVETAGAARKRAARLLEEVGLPAAALDRYPHEFSGGQRQRLAIARALALEPALLVADEPVSALDVTVQAQILELLQRLNRERGLSLLFISHDLAVVRFLADRVAVMHRGRLVEQGPTERVYDRPEHPYTRRLLASVPRPPVSGHGPAPP